MIIKLYVAGDSEKTRINITDVETVLKRIEKDPAFLEVVDVLLHPQAAMDDQILATPTLLIQRSGNTQRVIGDFGDTEKIMKILDPGNTALTEDGE